MSAKRILTTDSSSSSPVSIDALETAVGYRFAVRDRLFHALRHRSFVNEENRPDMAAPALSSNERLEFLGDAVLNLVVSHLLMHRFPDLTEGDLSRSRAMLVNETQLAAIAREIDISPHLLLGKGETLTGGREKNSILADAVEAVIGAIYLDGGFDAAFDVVSRCFRTPLNRIGRAGDTDPKTRLQERVQLHFHAVPHYELVEESGPDHDKTFRMQVTVAGISAEGTGKSKKMAQQAAAQTALAYLDAHPEVQGA